MGVLCSPTYSNPLAKLYRTPVSTQIYFPLLFATSRSTDRNFPTTRNLNNKRARQRSRQNIPSAGIIFSAGCKPLRRRTIRRASQLTYYGMKVGHDPVHDCSACLPTVQSRCRAPGITHSPPDQLVRLCRSGDILPLATDSSLSAINANRATIFAGISAIGDAGPGARASRPGELCAPSSWCRNKPNSHSYGTTGPA